MACLLFVSTSRLIPQACVPILLRPAAKPAEERAQTVDGGIESGAGCPSSAVQYLIPTTAKSECAHTPPYLTETPNVNGNVPRLMEPLDRLDPLLHNRGTIYESEILHFIKLAVNFIVRGFEFGLTDGALAIDKEFFRDSSFADIFWMVHSASNGVKGRYTLLLFDVKARLSPFAGDAVYVETTRQQSQAAFHLGFCAADPRYVELIPNYHQDPERCDPISQQPLRYVAVNSSRVCRFPPVVYGLDPSNAPYRMPLAYLPGALSQLRDCVRHQRTYVNPWTQVPFTQWRPVTTTSSEALAPLEDHDHYSGFEAILDLYRRIKWAEKPISLDFMCLQPRIADFKLVIGDVKASHMAKKPRQYFIQHKLDGRHRQWGAPLTNVSIARGADTDRGLWYFSHTDGFDFLFYQFQFSEHRTGKPETQFFFLPEFVLPDSFYITREREASFERPDFQVFRVDMDSEGRWIDRVLEIIHEYPSPRRTVSRPIRRLDEVTVEEQQSETRAGSLEQLDLEILQPVQETLPASRPARIAKNFTRLTLRKHRHFYHRIMDECCLRRRGLLVVLDKDHPLGDFAFCGLHWSQEEVAIYREIGKPPRTLDDLPGDMPMLALYYFAREVDFTSGGPNFTAPQFRRLNGYRENRLIIWDIWTADQGNISHPLIVVPSDDLGATTAQRSLYRRSLGVGEAGVRGYCLPRLPYLLRDGRLTFDYVVGRRGPQAYDGDRWSDIWLLCWKFTRVAWVEHPPGCTRNPALCRNPLWKLHERLVLEQNRP